VKERDHSRFGEGNRPSPSSSPSSLPPPKSVILQEAEGALSDHLGQLTSTQRKTVHRDIAAAWVMWKIDAFELSTAVLTVLTPTALERFWKSGLLAEGDRSLPTLLIAFEEEKRGKRLKLQALCELWQACRNPRKRALSFSRWLVASKERAGVERAEAEAAALEDLAVKNKNAENALRARQAEVLAAAERADEQQEADDEAERAEQRRSLEEEASRLNRAKDEVLARKREAKRQAWEATRSQRLQEAADEWKNLKCFGKIKSLILNKY